MAIPYSHTTTTASTRNTLPFCRLVILKLLFAVLHVYAWCAGLQADAVPSSLLHDLRLLQLQLINAGDYDSVSRFPDVLQGPRYLIILRLDAGQRTQQAHQVSVIRHIKAGLLGQRLVEPLPGQADLNSCDAGAKINRRNRRLTDIFVLA